MAINDAVAAYAGQQNDAAAEYKDAWASAPSAGVGQFGSQGPFSGNVQGLSSVPGADIDALKTAASQATQASGTSAPFGSRLAKFGSGGTASGLESGVIDALPTTPAGKTSTDPIADVAATIGNYTAEKPYVSDVTDAGDVGRQEVRPERLSIDDTMTADEQYRRAWQNEANGYYGNSVDKVAPPPAAPAPEPEPAPAPAPAASAHSLSDDDRALLDTILRERREAEYSNRFA